MGTDSDRRARGLRNLLLLAALLLTGTAVWWAYGCGKRAATGTKGVPDTDTITLRDTTYIRDTLLVRTPIPTDGWVDTIGFVSVDTDAPHMPQACHEAPSEADTAATLPVVQVHYADSLYEAWVSGVAAAGRAPRLDSLRLYPRSMVVTETRTVRPPMRRWGLSVGAGAVATPTGIEPGVFVGLTYTFVTF